MASSAKSAKTRRWQIRQNEQGLCAACTEPLAENSRCYCAAHAEYHRQKGNERYRRAHPEARRYKTGKPTSI